MASSNEPDTNPYHVYAQKILDNYHADLTLRGIFQGGSRSEPFSIGVFPHLRPISRVAIVGAGVAGLSAAMKLNQPDQPFEIDIFESNKRVGGRLYTHHFNDESNTEGKYNYFDVGAMRFPNIPSMDPTFDLFKRLNIPTLKYYRTQDANWLYYNNTRLRRSEVNSESAPADPFNVSIKKGGDVPNDFVEKGPQHWYDKAIDPFVKRYQEDAGGTLDDLLKNYDHYSIRSYMAGPMGYPTRVINWIETMNSGTAWFDRALIEAIMEGVTFAKEPEGDNKATIWECVDGGSDVISTKMVAYLKDKAPKVSLHRQHHVTSVKFDGTELEVSGLREGDTTTFSQRYSHVILAINPTCMRTIDISTCELDFGQRNGLRELQLAPSSKIGMRFKTAWWTEKGQGITGGQSQTDRLARTIVYPSHGGGASTVLIVSYVWTEDSLLLGALMHGAGSPEEKRLKALMLADLAQVHKKDLSFLESEFECMYAFDWNNNPLSMGAFGLFGPGQWGRFFSSLNRPAARGQLYFVGETFSAIHGWVAGALESASEAVDMILNEHRWARIQRGEPDRAELPDPLITFKADWKPRFSVNEKSLELQLAASLLLQKAEYGY